MSYAIVISSGHGKYIRGAADILDEVDEARRIVNRVAELLRNVDVDVTTYHDDISTSQNENLNRIVDFHNSRTRDLDISVHLNAYEHTSKPMGTECLYVSQEELAAMVSAAIAIATGLPDRGPKERTDLFFLNNTDEPAILIETVFVDSSADASAYERNFEEVCQAIAESVSGEAVVPIPPRPDRPGRPEPEDEHPTIAEGDEGPAVEEVQTILGIIPYDGDFGPTTDGGVKGFQAAAGLSADGVVGPKTWSELDDLAARKRRGAGTDLEPDLEAAIVEVAGNSAIAEYSWRDRGRAPTGYTVGVALCFAMAMTWLLEGDDAAARMARADTGDEDKDALAWYADEFEDAGMDNSKDGIDTLRHLFALILGLGMRESSGRYCEGRDMSASNVAADTAEAGMFQTSWNIRSCDSEIPPLLQIFWDNPSGFLSQFQVGVWPDGNDLGNFGSGDGAKYQFLSKYAPTFHAFVTALGLRSLRQHWGPINRGEVELKTDANKMLFQVQQLVLREDDIV